MDKEAKEVLVIFASIAFLFLVFLKLANFMFFPPRQNIGINDEIVEVKKQKEVLDKIEKQNEEIIKLLKK